MNSFVQSFVLKKQTGITKLNYVALQGKEDELKIANNKYKI